MMAKTYREKLLDPRWQKRRLEVLEEAGWKCVECGESDRTLHVHHGYYKKGAEPWDYHDCELHVLCDECHERFTEVRRALDADIGRLTPSMYERVRGYVQAMLASDFCDPMDAGNRNLCDGIADFFRVDPEATVRIAIRYDGTLTEPELDEAKT